MRYESTQQNGAGFSRFKDWQDWEIRKLEEIRLMTNLEILKIFQSRES
jgi:hypothetical protein